MKQMNEDLADYGEISNIRDRDTIDAVIAYKLILQSTREIYGEENLTESVMCKAIEAASYIGYRSIMGQASQTMKRI